MGNSDQRRKQVADAQRRRREKLRRKGQAQVSVFLSKTNLVYIDELANRLEVDRSRALDDLVAQHATNETRHGFAPQGQSFAPIAQGVKDDEGADNRITILLSKETIERLDLLVRYAGVQNRDELLDTLILDSSLEGIFLAEAIYLMGLHYRRMAEGGTVSYDELCAELPKYFLLAVERSRGWCHI